MSLFLVLEIFSDGKRISDAFWQALPNLFRETMIGILSIMSRNYTIRDSERIPLSVDERSRLEKKYDYYGASGVIDKVDKCLFKKPLSMPQKNKNPAAVTSSTKLNLRKP